MGIGGCVIFFWKKTREETDVKKQERRPTYLGEADDMGIGGWVFFMWKK
jgi:hypothetical protein